MTVQLSTQELEVLLVCFDSAIATIQRTEEFLSFFKRQMEDEKQTLTEARTATAIAELMSRSE